MMQWKWDQSDQSPQISVKQRRGLEKLIFEQMFGSPWASKLKINAYYKTMKVFFWPCMHVNLLLGIPKPKYEPFITHNRGTLRNCRSLICTSRPRRTTVVDDQRILSMVKKNPFTTSNEEKNTLQEVESLQSREDYTNTEGSPQGANKDRLLDFTKKHLKMPDHFWKSILWTAEIKINLYQNDGKKKVWRSSWSKTYNIICETWWRQCDGLSVHGFQLHWVTGV